MLSTLLHLYQMNLILFMFALRQKTMRATVACVYLTSTSGSAAILCNHTLHMIFHQMVLSVCFVFLISHPTYTLIPGYSALHRSLNLNYWTVKLLIFCLPSIVLVTGIWIIAL